MSNLRRIGLIDELIEAIRDKDPLRVAELREEQDRLLKQERITTMTNAAKCLIASREIRIRLN